jgi:hypothetical protein
VVAVEYFTKWIEAKPLVNIASASLKNFFWKNIIYRFRVPRVITVDNANQFDYVLFKDLCYHIVIEAAFTSVYQPQSNEAVERANALIFTAIKKCLEDQKKGKRAEELPKVVWRHNISISRATNFTPFKLLFEDEVVTPEEIKFKTARTRSKVVHNSIEAESKDLLEPERLKVV